MINILQVKCLTEYYTGGEEILPSDQSITMK